MADKDYCNACNELKENNAELILNGVTQAICQSLANNTGLNPENGNNNCVDLDTLHECLMGQMLDTLEAYDICDWKEFMEKYATNAQTLMDALLCGECGQWENIDDLWTEISKIWNEINNLWNAINNITNNIQGLVSQNYVVETRFNVAQQTPEFSITVARDGTFEFRWSDWLGANQRLGRGILKGKVNFCMSPQANQYALWKITSFTLTSVQYITDGLQSAPFTVTLRVPDGSGAIVYQRAHNTLTNFTDNVNQTVNVNKQGSISHSGGNSGWVTFSHFYNDGTVADDEGDVQIRFTNNNLTPVPTCS